MQLRRAVSDYDTALFFDRGSHRNADGRALASRRFRFLHLIHARTFGLIFRHIGIRFLLLADALIQHGVFLPALRIRGLGGLTLMRRRTR